MKVKIVILMCSLFLVAMRTEVVLAQTKPQQNLAFFQAELGKRGLTEEEAKGALAAIGIDPATASAEELTARQDEITKALDAAAANKAGNTKEPATKNTSSTDAEKSATANDSLVSDSMGKANESTSQMQAAPVEAPNQIYGHAIFQGKSLTLFTTTDGAKAPETYILGTGDQLRVTIFGVSQADLQFEINSEGYVQPAGLPQIYLQGLTLADARRLLKQRFSTAYRFQSDQFALTLQKARTVQVNVFGETKIQGTFVLSALNSPFGALMAAGGPNELGSVRAIELIRGKNRKRIDVYAFLRNPSIATELDLQTNDILYVPIAPTVVSIEGPVKRPMRYELTQKEGLKELIEMAGGLQFNSYSEFVQVERFLGDSAALIEYKLADVINGKLKVQLGDGDVVRIRIAERQLEAFSEVIGAVFYPGRYAFTSQMKLGELINKAQLRPEAVVDVAIVERLNRDGTTKLLRLNGDQFNDFELQFRDKVTIFNKSQFANQASLVVTGAVRTPFERKLGYGDEILLENALLAAGGLTPTAEELAYVRRIDLSNPEIVSYIPINLIQDKGFNLRAGDELMIYDKTMYSLSKSLRVTGAVNNPISLTYNPALKIGDVMRMAGGFTLSTDKSRVDVFRLSYEKAKGTGYERIILELDSEYNVVGGTSNFKLAPFDIVVVRDLPLFDLDRTVQIAGPVAYPGTYALEADRVHLSHVLKKAGGLNVMADIENAIIVRSAGSKGTIGVNPIKAMRNAGNNRHDPILLPGDVIEIQMLQNTVGMRLRATREADLMNAGVEVRNANENEIRYFTYRGARSARWYIRNLAGGFAEKANKNSVTVVYPDGSVVGTRTYFGFIRNYPNLKPGAVVSLNYKIPKEKKEKEKVDVDALYTRTLTSLTTLVTLIILARQL